MEILRYEDLRMRGALRKESAYSQDEYRDSKSKNSQDGRNLRCEEDTRIRGYEEATGMEKSAFGQDLRATQGFDAGRFTRADKRNWRCKEARSA